MKKQLRICTILLILNIAMLFIMLGGINLLRIFDTTLIRQTEISLNTQAVFIAAIYRDAYTKAINQKNTQPIRVNEDEVTWKPIKSRLDRASSPLLAEAPPPLKFDGEITLAEEVAGLSIIRILQEAQLQTLASIRIVNSKGMVVSSTNLKHRISLVNRPEVVEALKGEHQAILRKRTLTQPNPSIFSISRGTAMRVHIVHPIKYEGTVIGAVVLARTPESISQVLGRHIFVISLYLGIVFALIWLLAAFTSYTIRKPIEAVVAQAQRAANGEKGAVTPLEKTVTYEVAELSRSVAKMAQTLEHRADYILEFASHLSHQFKTPVTAIQGAVELLIDHGETMTKEESQRFLKNLNQDAQYLEKLVYRLLDFAKADLRTPSNTDCSTNDIITALTHEYRERNSQVKLKYSHQKDVKVRLEAEALDTILRNLIDNAIQADAKNIDIKITLCKHEVTISISDDGIPISQANQDKIFSPFFTTTKAIGGTGLGLPIISTLVKSAKGKLHLDCSEAWKTFRLTLLRAQ